MAYRGPHPPMGYPGGPPGFLPGGFQPPPHPGMHPPPPGMFPPPNTPMMPPVPPNDPQLHQSIDKTAEFIVSRAADGATFEQTLRDKERNNPNFAFMFPGAPFFDYYQYKLHQLRSRPAAPSGTPVETVALTLSTDRINKLKDSLLELTGSQQSILSLRTTLTEEYQGHEQNVAHFIRRHIQEINHPDKKLFGLYLISDILHANMKKRPDDGSLDIQTAAFLNELPAVFRVFAGWPDPEYRSKAEKVLAIWENRALFDAATIARLRLTLSPPPPTAAAPPPMHPPHPHHGFGAPVPPPPHMLGMAPPGFMPHPHGPPPPMMPPGALPPPPQALAPPVGLPPHLDPNVCLPAGLLVSHMRLHQPEKYTPINPATINMAAAAGPIDDDTRRRLNSAIDGYLAKLPGTAPSS